MTSQLVAARRGMLNPSDLPPEHREICERLLTTLKTDFATFMHSFRRANPRAQPADLDSAWINAADSTFHVPINEVAHVDMQRAQREAARFGATLNYLRGIWTLSTPLADDARARGEWWRRPELWVAVAAGVIVVVANFPELTWQLVLFFWAALRSLWPTIRPWLPQ